jgi:adenine-specific DNA-methyltransferase
MATPREIFQGLIRDLFQFDLADLDFGIYRLFRLKKDELEKFINVQIPQAVEMAFADLAEGDTGRLKAEVADLAQKIRDELEVDAILDDGAFNPRYDKKTIGKTVSRMVNDYEEKFKRLRGLLATENQKDDVFNHLHAFFSRYYDRGDFIARRFFGSRPHYAVPYNGEETHFHWANKDQHYIKSGEAFRDYSFTVADILGGPARVRFALTKASVPPGDTKGDRRYFFPHPEESKWDVASRTFTVAFHYRLPVEAELKSAPVEENGAAGENGDATADNGNVENGKAAKPKKISGDKLQEKLLADALESLVAACPEAGLADALRKVLNQEEVERDGKPPVTYLAKRMRHFARRQTSDYFVHKNLAAFLREELDFYIKDQVMHVADLEGDFEGKRRMLRALRELAGQIIAFLHQIEEVQRRLFEKRKFVLRTDYLCPVQNVPRVMWKEICANKRQLAKWVHLYALDKDSAGEDDLFAFKGKLTESFLESHPTLVVNTALFDENFKWRLLETFDDLDAVLDGVLVKSENYQALQLMQRKLASRVDTCYNDPPYNTGQDFIYKDTYQHSSWLSKMEGLTEAVAAMLKPKGALFTSIDDNEYHQLVSLQARIFGQESEATIIRVNPSTKSWAEFLSITHDYCVVSIKPGVDGSARKDWSIRKPYIDEFKKRTKALLKMKLTDEEKRMNLRELVKIPMFKAFDHYTEFDENGIYRSGNPNRTLQSEGAKVFPDVVLKHPVTNKKCEISENWRFDQAKTDEIAARTPTGFHFGPDHKTVPGIKNYLEEYEDMTPQSVMFDDTQVDTKTILPGMGIDFDFPKPLSFVRRLVEASTGENAIVLDCYGGSGTTAHAVVDINREDAKQRRFVIIEHANYFEKTLHLRVEKVMFSPDWKDGKPKRLPKKEEAARTPRLVKVLRLESYEDALHNLGTDTTLATSEAKAAAFQGALGAESYRLNYIARLPLEASASMLQTAHLDHPFRYALEILTDDGAETQLVDLVETFNWLLGLDVQRVRRWQHEKRDYVAVIGRDRASKRLLIVWRDTADLDPKAERAFLEKQVAALTKDAPFDRMFINGDNAADFESLDALFKQLMEAE